MKSNNSLFRSYTPFERLKYLQNRFALGTIYIFGFLVALPLLIILFYLFSKGLPALSWEFFTQAQKPVGSEGGGIAHSIVGSSVVIFLSSLIGVPWGVLAGIFLAEFQTSRLSKFLRFLVDLLLSVPSIVVGIFAYTIFVLSMGGFSAYAGAGALAIILIPMIARSTEESLKMIEPSVRHAGLALGLPRWKVFVYILLRVAKAPILTGIMLSIARIAGETAPLLFTAFYSSTFLSHGGEINLSGPIATLPIQIFNYATSGFDEWKEQAWAASFSLIIFVMGVNLFVRLVLRSRKT